MKIKDLRNLDLQAEWLGQVEDQNISYITDDSRYVKKDGLFLCYSQQPIAYDYIRQALQAGAKIIAVSSALKSLIIKNFSPLPEDVIWVFHHSFRHFASTVAVSWFPEQPSMIAAVTGTNGKTSTVQFLYQLWTLKGIKAASLGTLGLQSKMPSINNLSMTTLSPLALHETLNDLSQQGVTHVALEASSHGLDQHRLEHVTIKAAGFTNLTQDHLDYHQTMEHYFLAKEQLFTMLLKNKKNAVINADDSYAVRLQRTCPHALTYSLHNTLKADLYILDCHPQATGQQLRIKIQGQEFELFFPHLGNFLVANALCAFGLLLKTVPNCSPSDIMLLEKLTAVKGRLQWVGDTSSDAKIFIDYAHTPDGLENVLKSLKSLPHNRLMVLFGCGGDRDPSKRFKMGQVAHQWANWIGITDDNPRTEDPRTIRHQIHEGCPGAHDLGDRETAIAQSISLAKAGDILLIAGKGHETVQTIGTTDYHFDDQKVVEKYLQKSISKMV